MKMSQQLKIQRNADLETISEIHTYSLIFCKSGAETLRWRDARAHAGVLILSLVTSHQPSVALGFMHWDEATI